MAIPMIIYLAPLAGFLSIGLSIFFGLKVKSSDPGNEKMRDASHKIEKGAKAFIKRQYVTLALFSIALAIIILVAIKCPLPDNQRMIPGALNWEQALAYLFGACSSMIAGIIGMMVGVKANTRSAQACSKGVKEGFNVAFFGGAVMGLAVVGFAIIGTSAFYFLMPNSPLIVPHVVLGFSFGCSSVALFMKCGGGIYTKTADVGADLVGKVEYDMPEDDMRNPAAIADNVGDNVGDIAGMGSDLLDSYVASIVAAMLLALSVTIFAGVADADRILFIIYPLILCAAGLFASLIGILFIRSRKSGEASSLLNNGTYLSTGIFAIFAIIVTFLVISSLTNPASALSGRLWRDCFAGIIGLGAGVVIGFTTDYFTDDGKSPVRKIAEAAKEGHAIVILSGMAYGLISVVPSAAGIVLAMGLTYVLDGMYGIAIGAVGMLSIVCTIVGNDAYGPITDNARSIAEAGQLPPDVIRHADHLDSAGNTAKAITKGFAIGAANLTVVALLFSYAEEAGTGLVGGVMNLLNVNILIGAFIGVLAPPFFTALLILAVQRNAATMVLEIRRQFESDPDIMAGKKDSDYEKCVDIATKGALRELILPSIISIVAPLGVGVLLGVGALGAFLAGSILSGFVWAVFASTAGGAWDNAKKYIEDDQLKDANGKVLGKGTDAHKAGVTGDTVGDPLKDTAGPSLNTLLCVMSLTATIFMPLFLQIQNGAGFIQLIPMTMIVFNGIWNFIGTFIQIILSLL